jgi:hypothetical protein
MFGEFEEGDVFFAHVVKDADGAVFLIGEADDFSTGSAEIALERKDLLGKRAKVLREERFEDVKGHDIFYDSVFWKRKRAGRLAGVPRNSGDRGGDEEKGTDLKVRHYRKKKQIPRFARNDNLCLAREQGREDWRSKA